MISDKSNINCNFEGGFKEIKDNNTINYKDIEGRNLLLKIIFVFILFFFTKNKKYRKIISLIIVLLLIYIIKKICDRPIRFLHMSSYLISNFTRTPPYLDLDEYFPNHSKFESKENFDKIKKEVDYILNFRDKLKLTKNTFDAKENNYIGGGDKQNDNEDGWRLYLVKSGTLYPAKNTMPYLTSMLKEYPEIHSCAVSILPGNKTIPIHIGYYKGVLRYQLAITVPKNRENVFICVNGIKYNWTEGQGVLFDDCYAHKVYNDTEEDRIVLYMDIERPSQNLFFKIFNKILIQVMQNIPSIKKEAKDTETLINIS